MYYFQNVRAINAANRPLNDIIFPLINKSIQTTKIFQQKIFEEQ